MADEIPPKIDEALAAPPPEQPAPAVPEKVAEQLDAPAPDVGAVEQFDLEPPVPAPDVGDAEQFDLTGIEIPDDQPKFFRPPELQEHPITATDDYSMDQLPPEANKTLERLLAEAQTRSPQQQRVQSRSAARSAQRRQRLGESATPQQQQANQDVWAGLEGWDDAKEQSFDDSFAQEDAAPQVAGRGGGAGGQDAGMEKMVAIGERLATLVEQMSNKLDALETAMQSVAEAMQEQAGRWG
jgi:hypothetical protein